MELIETKLDHLQGRVLDMVRLVKSQVQKSKDALLNKDEALADAVILADEEVDEADVKINQNCEQILALFNPVAIDLRVILTSIKISLSLERIGDHAEGICYSFKEIPEDFNLAQLEAFKISEMFETAETMLEDFSQALKNKDLKLAKSIYKKDRFLNKAYAKSVKTAVKLIKQDVAEANTILQLLSVVRKIERMGDLTKNMSLEVIFHLTGKFPNRKPKGKKKKKSSE